MAINRIFDWLIKSKTEQNSGETKSFYQTVYPESVRYALQYREAKMGKEEMEALLGAWTFEAVYLVTKAVAFERELQRKFLENLTILYYKNDWEMQELRDLLRHYIKLLPVDVTVTGTKLAQLSRIGGNTWQDEWRNLAETVATEKPDALPCLMAHTPIYGYHQFIKVYRDSKQDILLLLMPDWIMNPDETHMGYEIRLKNSPTVNLQLKRECLYGTWTCDGANCRLNQLFCKQAIFIDDTINSGKTAGKLQSFWLSKYGLNMPLDRVHVITNLRDNEMTRKHAD